MKKGRGRERVILAIYLTTREDVLPSALSLNLKHNGVLHEHLLLLKVTTADDLARVASLL